MKTPRALTFALAVLSLAAGSRLDAQILIPIEFTPSAEGWDHVRTIDPDFASSRAIAPHFGPNGEIYFGARDGGSEDGLYRVAPGGTTATQVAGGFGDVAGLAVDPTDGDVFLTSPHHVRRHAAGSSGAPAWSTTLMGPEGQSFGLTGVAIAPPGYFDPVAGSSARGVTVNMANPDALRKFSTVQSGSALGTLQSGDAVIEPPLQDPTDVCFAPIAQAYSSHTIFVADAGQYPFPTGIIWKATFGHSSGDQPPILTALYTTQDIVADAIVWDDAIGRLLVLDRTWNGHRIVTVDPVTGDVTQIGSFTHGSANLYGSIDISADGSQMVLTTGTRVYVYEREVPNEPFTRGDANLDGSVQIADAIFILLHLNGDESSTCLDAADANNDATVDLSDVISILMFIVGEQPSLPAPFPNCGADSGTSLGCADGGC